MREPERGSRQVRLRRRDPRGAADRERHVGHVDFSTDPGADLPLRRRPHQRHDLRHQPREPHGARPHRPRGPPGRQVPLAARVRGRLAKAISTPAKWTRGSACRSSCATAPRAAAAPAAPKSASTAATGSRDSDDARRRMSFALLPLLALRCAAAPAIAQNDYRNPNMAPVNDLPNPYSDRQVMPLPDGRTWGSTAGVDAAKGRDDIWAIDRCGSNTCVGSHVESAAALRRQRQPDRPDGRRLVRVPARHPRGPGRQRLGDRPAAARRPRRGRRRRPAGHEAEPDGEILLQLGTRKVAGDGPNQFSSPSDVVVGRNGDIFVADGHGEGTNERIMKFDKDGKFIKSWGKPGNGAVRRGRVLEPARARDRFTRPALHRRSRQQPHPDLRSGRQLPRLLVPVQPPERHLHRRRRQLVRRRLRVARRRQRGPRPGSPGLAARHPHRQRARRLRASTSFRIPTRRAAAARRGRRRDQGRRGRLRRRGRARGHSFATTDGKRAGGQRGRSRALSRPAPPRDRIRRRS